jgi:hypothetical protein
MNTPEHHGCVVNPIRTTPHSKGFTMNTTSRHLSAIAIVTAALCSAFAALPAQAQARERHTTVTGANGKTATRDAARHNGDVQSSTTGPNGKTSSRSVDRSASGTVATVTGPNGKTGTRTTTRTVTGATTSPAPATTAP